MMSDDESSTNVSWPTHISVTAVQLQAEDLHRHHNCDHDEGHCGGGGDDNDGDSDGDDGDGDGVFSEAQDTRCHGSNAISVC